MLEKSVHQITESLIREIKNRRRYYGGYQDRKNY